MCGLCRRRGKKRQEKLGLGLRIIFKDIRRALEGKNQKCVRVKVVGGLFCFTDLLESLH